MISLNALGTIKSASVKNTTTNFKCVNKCFSVINEKIIMWLILLIIS